MGGTEYTISGPFGRNRDFSELFAPAGEYNVDYTSALPTIDDSMSDAPKVMDIVNALNSGTISNGSETGGVNELSLNPSMAADQLTDAEIYAGYSPNVEERVTDSLTQSVIDALKGNAASMALVGQLGGQVNPADILNPQSLLTAIPNAMMAGEGIEAPDGILGSAVKNIPGVLGSMLLGPAGGMIGGLVGPAVADGLGDLFGFRDADKARDLLEEASGQLRGRRQYRSARDRYGVDDVRYAEEEGNFADAGQRAAYQLQQAQQKPFTNIDLIQDQMNKTKMYQELAAIQEYNDAYDRYQQERGGEGASKEDWQKYGSIGYTPGNEKSSRYRRRSNEGGGNGFSSAAGNGNSGWGGTSAGSGGYGRFT